MTSSVTFFASVALSFSSFVIAAEKPNLLFIFADDQAFSTIHHLGNAEIQTPNLDRLAARSTTLTHAYNMGSWSGAVCVASRTMLNTGQFVWRAEKADLKARQDRGELWSQLLQSAGYQTFFTGKWHVKADPEAIFDVSNHVRPGMPAQTPEGYGRPLPDQPDPWSPSDPQFGGFWEGGRHWSEIVADDATAFLQAAARDTRPFFIYAAFNAPHDPRQSPQSFVDRYPLDSLTLPVNFLPEYPFNEAMQSGRSLRDEKLAPFPRTEQAVLTHIQEYYAIITHMDEQIGRILDELNASGQAANTVVIFSADHGLGCGQHGLMGKQNMYDHSLRVPLILSGPGIPQDQKIDAPVYLQDIMPTTLELAGVDQPEYVEFHSLLPVLTSGTSPYDAIYGGYLQSQRAIIRDGFKLILYPKAPKALLFDLTADPHEMTDLSEDPSHAPRLKSLFAALLQLQQSMDDTVDLSSTFPGLL